MAVGDVKSRSSSAPGPGIDPAATVAADVPFGGSGVVNTRMNPSASSFSSVWCSLFSSMPDFLRRSAAVDLPSTARKTMPASRGSLEDLFLTSSTPLGVFE